MKNKSGNRKTKLVSKVKSDFVSLEHKKKPFRNNKNQQSSFLWKKKLMDKLFNRKLIYNLFFNPYYISYAACLFLVGETILSVFIIQNVKYTEIDWKAYMQEAEGFLNGTFNYSMLKGDTGPLVYPAGFLYFFSGLYYLTNGGRNVILGQYLFAAFYIMTLALVFRIYYRSKKLPPYILLFVCCVSYRIHSIFVLRLFNDGVAMMIFYASLNCFISGWWMLGSFIYSLAVSMKMNVLLFAPALFMSYLYCLGIKRTIINLFICAATQVLLATPFLLHNPTGYITRAFDVGRVFLFQWTVNWKFLPQNIFIHRYFHLTLLALHVVTLCIFAYTHWHRYLTYYKKFQNTKLDVGCQLFLLPMFISNYVGIVFSRSLHYQFYVWYFHSLPYLLWSTKLNISTRLLILGAIELSWNVYPATPWSSLLLHSCHFILLVSLLYNRPTTDKVESVRKFLLKND